MKFLPIFVTLVAGANAHAIFQRMAVNGADQGQLVGIRAPEDSGPVTNVNDKDFACNKDLTYLDKTVITVPAGAKVGALFGHVIGGAMGPDDTDQPIAEDHKGPIMVYLARVDDAATASPDGLSWFKISEKGLNNGRWAVDDMRADDGWHNFTMPSCVASGEYLMRVELLALQESQLKNGAQFYMECAQIRVEGTGTNTGSDFAKFPGTYKANDPGIFLDVYNDEGVIDNSGRPYKIPGPMVLSC